jgi:hypothetical protein
MGSLRLSEEGRRLSNEMRRLDAIELIGMGTLYRLLRRGYPIEGRRTLLFLRNVHQTVPQIGKVVETTGVADMVGI